MFKGKVKRFIVIPICTIEDSEGNPVREERGKPFPVLIGNLPDLKKVAEQLEVKYNDEYVSKVNLAATKLKRSTGDRGIGKSSKSSTSRKI